MTTTTENGATTDSGMLDKLCQHSRYLQQTGALTYKNAIVAWRSRRATALRLLAPFMFLLLALIIQLSLDANNKREKRIRETEVAEVEIISSIPDCHQDLYIRDRPCITFIYTPNSSAVVDGIITRIKANNQPPIANHKVLGFASRIDADQYMLSHPETTLGAVHFFQDNLTGADIKYVIQANSTTKGFRGQYQSPVTFFTLPFTSAVAREASRAQLLAAGVAADVLQWAPQLLKFPHPQLRSIGMVGYVLGPFIFAACMFGMVTQLAAIVSEKEQGLVTALRHMGLLQSSYWSSWVLFDLLMGLLTALSIVICGLILQFRFFLHNDAGLLVLLFWLFSIAMSSFSYFLSVFMSKQTTATYTGFAVFLIGWICQTMAIFGLPYDPEYYFAKNNAGKAFFWIFACLPWAPLIKGCLDLAAATGSEKDPGLRWSERDSYCQYIPDTSQWPLHDPNTSFISFDCIFPLSQVFATLMVQAVGWLLLAVYLDNVYPGGGNHGVARPLWYFLLPSYWLKSTSSTARQLQQTESGLSEHKRSSSTIAGTSCVDIAPGNSSPGPAVRFAAELGHHSANHGHESQGASTSGAVREAWSVAGSGRPAVSGTVAGEDEDVSAESAKMQQLLKLRAAAFDGQLKSRLFNDPVMMVAEGQQGDPTSSADLAATPFAVEVYGLSKVFKGGSNRGACLPAAQKIVHDGRVAAATSRSPTAQASGGKAGDFCAIAGSWFGIEEGQLFCLLGPNGAGKTTTINCLTGILPPSGGAMLVCGESLASEGGLDRVRSQIGVCAQFDVLWAELTGLEHLVVAGHVKGIPPSQVKLQALELLQRVQLLPAAAMRSIAYSGGMKRRLSVALAMTGNPKVLYLDEPTTGMDPISRRSVWDVIQAAKPGRAIVLTTHSMEEADILGDRIAIMARGKLKAIGSSIHLKQKYGAGYQVVVTLKGPAKHYTPTQQRHKPTAAAAVMPPAASALVVETAMSTSSSTDSLNVQQRQQHDLNTQLQTPGLARQAIKDLFAAHLSALQPFEEGRQFLRYAVPRERQEQLMVLLSLLDAALGRDADVHTGSSNSGVNRCPAEVKSVVAAAVSDVQLSLTSLEEVFLAIAKQAELEVAASTGASVAVQLPDSGKEVQVAVGQDWVLDAAVGQGYRIKWVQDEAGKLAVLKVVPAYGAQPLLLS